MKGFYVTLHIVARRAVKMYFLLTLLVSIHFMHSVSLSESEGLASLNKAIDAWRSWAA